MTARALMRGWNEFFFAPIAPTPIALYRILYGALNVANLLLMHGDWLTWFGPHGAVTADTVQRLRDAAPVPVPWPSVSILSLLPHTDAAVTTFYWIFFVAAICVALGLLSRVSTIVVYICLLSIEARNPFIMNGGDQLLRVTGFFLMFAPAGAALSVDRLWRIWRGREGLALVPRSPWAQRMIQIQITVMYIGTVWWKTLGDTWLDGTAIHYALGRIDFRRFPVPGLDNPLMIRLATWGTLLTEFSSGVLIWLRDLRYPVILVAIALHLGIEYTMVIPLFEWITIAGFVTFVYPEDLTRVWSWVRRRAGPWLGAPMTLIYDGASVDAARAATVLQTIDVFGRLRIIDTRSGDANAVFQEIAARAGQGRLLVLTGLTARTGFAGLCTIAPRVPLLWPLAPLVLLTSQASPAAPAPTAAP